MIDAIATQQNIRMKRGDTPSFLLTVTDISGAAFDITGYTIWFTAKNSPDDADPGVFQISTVTGDITITSAAGGLATIVPPATATSSFTTDRTLFYDVQIRNLAATRTYTVCNGSLQVVRDITRA